jgi:phosphatidylglycerol---prolipoprotein diacylglyceryl transferase
MASTFSALLVYLHWNPNPDILHLFGPFTLRWYGVLFSAGFVVGYFLMRKMFRREGRTDQELDVLTMTMMISTVVGARLGHVLFYEPARYFADPISILYLTEGGLASHGAAIGILIGIWLFMRKRSQPGQGYLWLMDRIVITAALGGAFIRIGNLINSEIIGAPATIPWAFVFTRIDMIPRHPSQIYEAIYCLVTFALLLFLYRRANYAPKEGLLFGVFLLIIFGGRIFVERFKENQEPFENGLVLNMGQILSIPLLILGVILVYRATRKPGAPTPTGVPPSGTELPVVRLT